MANAFNRRSFLLATSAVAGSAGVGSLLPSRSRAASMEVPVVDKLNVRVLVDSSFDTFLRPSQLNGVTIAPARSNSDYRRSLHNEWGLSLWLESQRNEEHRSIMLDWGYTPEVLANNIELMGVDTSRLNALIVSHGHFDHYGGLIGFLDRFRGNLPRDIKLYAGGEDNFCQRLGVARTPGQFTEAGILDRRELDARKITTILAENPQVVADHAFTTGRIARQGIEKVLPNTMVKFGKQDGLGCTVAPELSGEVVPDEHLNEHATCFHVKDKGLVVISSCGHVGIVNTTRQAQEVSGVTRVHAILGGFHLGPAPKDYLQQVVAEIKKLSPDVVIPMHCSGLNFINEARAQMPGNVMLSSTGVRISFGA
jgi:7,8-dihydropterin-6-yl-methyl-4-(beta-D-ribofuranosyl)aminobenzene 5'-phosphate synthase